MIASLVISSLNTCHNSIFLLILERIDKTTQLVLNDIHPFIFKPIQTVRKLLPILLDIIVKTLCLLLDARYQDTLRFGLKSFFFDYHVQLTHLCEASRDEEIHELD